MFRGRKKRKVDHCKKVRELKQRERDRKSERRKITLHCKVQAELLFAVLL